MPAREGTGAKRNDERNDTASGPDESGAGARSASSPQGDGAESAAAPRGGSEAAGTGTGRSPAEPDAGANAVDGGVRSPSAADTSPADGA